MTATVFLPCLWREHPGLEGRAASATAWNLECRHSGTFEPFCVNPLLHIRSLSYESPMGGARWRRGRRFVLNETLDHLNCRAATICCLCVEIRRLPCRRRTTNDERRTTNDEDSALLDLHRSLRPRDFSFSPTPPLTRRPHHATRQNTEYNGWRACQTLRQRPVPGLQAFQGEPVQPHCAGEAAGGRVQGGD